MTSNREPCGTVLFVSGCHVIAPGHWHVVNDPGVHVPLNDPLPQEMNYLPVLLCFEGVGLLTKVLIGHVLPVHNLVRRRSQSLPKHDLS